MIFEFSAPKNPQNTLETTKNSSEKIFGRSAESRPKLAGRSCPWQPVGENFFRCILIVSGVVWGFSRVLISKIMLKIFYDDSFHPILKVWVIILTLTLIRLISVFNKLRGRLPYRDIPHSIDNLPKMIFPKFRPKITTGTGWARRGTLWPQRLLLVWSW